MSLSFSGPTRRILISVFSETKSTEPAAFPINAPPVCCEPKRELFKRTLANKLPGLSRVPDLTLDAAWTCRASTCCVAEISFGYLPDIRRWNQHVSRNPSQSPCIIARCDSIVRLANLLPCAWLDVISRYALARIAQPKYLFCDTIILSTVDDDRLRIPPIWFTEHSLRYARHEKNIEVRCQLACSARRLSTSRFWAKTLWPATTSGISPSRSSRPGAC